MYRNNLINVIHKLIDINDSNIRLICNLINHDYLSYFSNSSFISEEKSKELYLLNRKRELEYFAPKISHDFIFQKEQSFSINRSNTENIRQINESRNAIYEMKPNPINYETNNFKKILSGDSNNLKHEEYNNLKIIINNKEGNLFNNSSIIRNPSTKSKYSNTKKNINTKNILDFGTDNEIKILKNKKMVYVNKDLLNNYSDSKYIKKSKNINFVIRNKTSSKYRGVSRNGNNWQVLIMINNKKYYLGNYPSEDLAARIYDIHALKMRGIKARTNFPYNDIQIKNILERNINIKCDEISEIMNQINS